MNGENERKPLSKKENTHLKLDLLVAPWVTLSCQFQILSWAGMTSQWQNQGPFKWKLLQQMEAVIFQLHRFSSGVHCTELKWEQVWKVRIAAGSDSIWWIKELINTSFSYPMCVLIDKARNHSRVFKYLFNFCYALTLAQCKSPHENSLFLASVVRGYPEIIKAGSYLGEKRKLY